MFTCAQIIAASCAAAKCYLFMTVAILGFFTPAFASCSSLSVREGAFVGTAGRKYLSNAIV